MEKERNSTKTSVITEVAEVEPPGEVPLMQSVKNLKNDNTSNEKPSFPISSKSEQFLKQHFPLAGINDWNNWKWQVRNSITSVSQLQRFLNLSQNELIPHLGGVSLPLRITPYYASLLDPNNPLQALRKTVVPVAQEFIQAPCEKADPLGEHGHSVTPNLVHRYPDRVLFLVTDFCATYCRYCTRSHMVAKDKVHPDISAWNQSFDYICNNKQIRDVIISGGDPLTLSDSRLEYLLNNLRSIEHVEIIRIGTKVPAIMPQRITTHLTRMLRKYHPLYFSVHFTHPDELTLETRTACNRLANVGIPLGSQTVLLKGINDNVETFRKLMHELLKARVRPYYIYQCDPIPGSAQFRTKVEKGLEIIKGLRGFTSGYGVPHYVIDAPGGGGKIPLLPEYYQGEVDGQVVLKNFEDNTFYYPNY